MHLLQLQGDHLSQRQTSRGSRIKPHQALNHIKGVVRYIPGIVIGVILSSVSASLDKLFTRGSRACVLSNEDSLDRSAVGANTWHCGRDNTPQSLPVWGLHDRELHR